MKLAMWWAVLLAEFGAWEYSALMGFCWGSWVFWMWLADV